MQLRGISETLFEKTEILGEIGNMAKPKKLHSLKQSFETFSRKIGKTFENVIYTIDSVNL
jgi:hypothetical protein